jgi:hypothetical protein
VRSGNEASSNATAVALSAQLYAPSSVAVLDSTISSNGRASSAAVNTTGLSTVVLTCEAQGAAGAGGAAAGASYPAPGVTAKQVAAFSPQSTGDAPAVPPACTFRLHNSKLADNVARRYGALHVGCFGLPCLLSVAGSSVARNTATFTGRGSTVTLWGASRALPAAVFFGPFARGSGLAVLDSTFDSNSNTALSSECGSRGCRVLLGDDEMQRDSNQSTAPCPLFTVHCSCCLQSTRVPPLPTSASSCWGPVS